MNQEYNGVYDIAVVGAGPAGATFARETAKARPDLRIILIDGQTKDSAKPCGGLLAPSAQKLLAKLDLVLPKSILEGPQVFAVETIDVEQKLVRYYQKYYLNMDRYAFDSWLISLVPEQVEICRARCNEIKKDGELYSLSLKNGDQDIKISAKCLVGADGGGSIVRRTFFKPMKVQYVSIQQWFENKGQKIPYYSCVFDAKTSDSCSWTIHKGDYLVFGGAFKKQGCREAFDEQKARLEAFLGSSFGEAVKTEACLVSSPRKMKDFCMGKEGVFLIGEAAGFISASSFEGFSSAIHSGKLLADAMALGKTCEEAQRIYRKSSVKLRCRLRARSVKRTLLCNRFIRKLIMKSGVQSLKLYADQ